MTRRDHYIKLKQVFSEQEEERSRLTREALADVDAGKVTDHQVVQAWANSLETSPCCLHPVDAVEVGEQS